MGNLYGVWSQFTCTSICGFEEEINYGAEILFYEKDEQKSQTSFLVKGREPPTQQNQTEKLSEPVHEPIGEPIEAECYRQGGDKHSMSNGWSDMNLTNHGSPEFSLPLSPTINGILSYPKSIDTELNAGNDDSSPIIAPINSNSQQSQRQVFNMVNIPDK